MLEVFFAKDQRCTKLVECMPLFFGAQNPGFCASNSRLLRVASPWIFFTQRVHPVLGRKNHSEAHALCDDFYFEMFDFEVLGGSEQFEKKCCQQNGRRSFYTSFTIVFTKQKSLITIGLSDDFLSTD